MEGLRQYLKGRFATLADRPGCACGARLPRLAKAGSCSHPDGAPRGTGLRLKVPNQVHDARKKKHPKVLFFLYHILEALMPRGTERFASQLTALPPCYCPASR